MTKHFMRAFVDQERAAAGKPGEPIRFVAATEGVKADGLDLQMSGAQIKRYRSNPVVTWVHDIGGKRLPIGRGEIEIQKGDMVSDILFDPEDEFARAVESKYRRGFLNAVSVNFDIIKREDEKVTEWELLEIAAVPVPLDPDALMERQVRSMTAFLGELGVVKVEDIETDERGQDRGPIPPHTTAKDPVEASWDGPAEVAAMPSERAKLRQAHAWVDGEADEVTKRAYKLPHHRASSPNVVWRGVAAGMARLLQAGTKIPDRDRRGVYNHLSRHYRQFDKEPPEFRTSKELEAFGPDEIRGLFLEGESDLHPELFERSDEVEWITEWVHGEDRFAGPKISAVSMEAAREKADKYRLIVLGEFAEERETELPDPDETSEVDGTESQEDAESVLAALEEFEVTDTGEDSDD